MGIHERARSLFERAVELPEAAVAPFLDAECGADAALRNEVDALLGADRAAPHRALRTLSPGARLLFAGRPGESIGPYRLIRVLGEGGFGVVWLAEQAEPVRREVALKIIKPGMDTRQVMARFAAERQTLAMLSHPNVARVFDGGATDAGRPYFAMECVLGRSLTEFCDEDRLTVSERLRLFLDVCGAISHAHQKGVIHRDIKPSNVLVQSVDGQAIVKVIDFGIAKAIGASADDLTRHTQAGQLIGTPDYMSPEQADASQDIDTRSDIYSLGVLLYELLTGSTPLRASGTRQTDISELLRAVRETEAPRPSTRVSRLGAAAADIAARRSAPPTRLRAQLRGDLDWIVMKSLDKDRTRRYESASALAADLERFLNDEPVLARPPSKLYRLRKLVKRNRLAVTAAAVVVFCLCGTVIGISMALVRAQQASAEAISAREQAEAVNEFLVNDLLGAANPERDGYKLTVVDATAHALRSIDQRFADKPELGAMVRTSIGGLYFSLGMLNESVEQLESALTVYRQRRGPRAYETLVAALELANTLSTLNRLDESERYLREVCRVGRETLGADAQLVQRADGLLGEVLQKANRHDEAEPLLREMLQKLRAAGTPDEIRIVVTMTSLAASVNAQGRKEEAAALYAELLELTRARFPRTHPATLSATNNMAAVLCDLKRYAEALPLQTELLEAVEGALPAGHYQIAIAEFACGVTLHKLGREADAKPHLTRGYNGALAALGPNHYITERCVTMLAATLRTLEDPDALALHRAAVETRTRVAIETDLASVDAKWRDLESHLAERGDGDAGQTVCRMLEETAESLIASKAENTQRYLANLGWALMERGRLDAADRWLKKSYELLPPPGENSDSAGTAFVVRLLADLHEKRGEGAEAAALRSGLTAASRPSACQ